MHILTHFPNESFCLLLGGLGQVVGLSLLGLLSADTPQSCDGSRLANAVEGLELLQIVGQLHGARPLDNLPDGQNMSGQLFGLAHLVGGGVSLPRLLRVDGEHDQLGLVLFQSLHVALKGLKRLVLATVIDADANGLCLQTGINGTVKMLLTLLYSTEVAACGHVAFTNKKQQ